jgi:outer membrane protein
VPVLARVAGEHGNGHARACGRRRSIIGIDPVAAPASPRFRPGEALGERGLCGLPQPLAFARRFDMRSYRLAPFMAAAAFAACGVCAAQSAAPLEPLWEVGGVAFVMSQQAYPGSDEQVNRGLALPYVIYRGPVLRADRGGVNVRAVKTPRVEVDIGFAGSFGSSSDDIDARRGMPDLGTLVQFGPRLKWNIGEAPAGVRWRFEVPLRGVFDIDDGFQSRGLAVEPEVSLRFSHGGGWNTSFNASLIAGNERLADTYYEVAPRHAQADRPAYDAQPGLITWRFGASTWRDLTSDWRLFAFGWVDSVAGARNEDSPLVKSRNGATVGVGVTYTWLRSERMAAD